MPDNRPLTYLAVPYSHPDPAVRLARFEAANIAAGALMREGELVFSPISHTHPIAVQCGLPLGFDYWEAYDRAVLSCCNTLIVLQLGGWMQSKGVQSEVKIALEANIEVRFMAMMKEHDGGHKWIHSKGCEAVEQEWLRLIQEATPEEMKRINVAQGGIYIAGTWIKDDPNDESNKE